MCVYVCLCEQSSLQWFSKAPKNPHRIRIFECRNRLNAHSMRLKWRPSKLAFYLRPHRFTVSVFNFPAKLCSLNATSTFVFVSFHTIVCESVISFFFQPKDERMSTSHRHAIALRFSHTSHTVWCNANVSKCNLPACLGMCFQDVKCSRVGLRG